MTNRQMVSEEWKMFYPMKRRRFKLGSAQLFHRKPLILTNFFVRNPEGEVSLRKNQRWATDCLLWSRGLAGWRAIWCLHRRTINRWILWEKCAAPFKSSPATRTKQSLSVELMARLHLHTERYILVLCHFINIAS